MIKRSEFFSSNLHLISLSTIVGIDIFIHLHNPTSPVVNRRGHALGVFTEFKLLVILLGKGFDIELKLLVILLFRRLYIHHPANYTTFI